MKITLDIKNKDIVASGLSHCLNLYGSLLFSVFIGCEIPFKFEKFFEDNNMKSLDEKVTYLNERFYAVKDLLEQLDKMED